LNQECVYRVKGGEKGGSENLEKQEEKREVTKSERELTVSQAIFRC